MWKNERPHNLSTGHSNSSPLLFPKIKVCSLQQYLVSYVYSCMGFFSPPSWILIQVESNSEVTTNWLWQLFLFLNSFFFQFCLFSDDWVLNGVEVIRLRSDKWGWILSLSWCHDGAGRGWSYSRFRSVSTQLEMKEQPPGPCNCLDPTGDAGNRAAFTAWLFSGVEADMPHTPQWGSAPHLATMGFPECSVQLQMFSSMRNTTAACCVPALCPLGLGSNAAFNGDSQSVE